MKVHSRIITLLDYKNRQKQQNNKERIIFFPLKTFSIFHIAILTKRSTFVAIKGPCSSTDRIEVS